jgi:hypothetical protein
MQKTVFFLMETDAFDLLLLLEGLNEDETDLARTIEMEGMHGAA